MAEYKYPNLRFLKQIMKHCLLTIKVLTPTFMRGSEKNRLQIRTNGIKGIMRWCFRSAIANLVGNNIKLLKEIESRCFGMVSDTTNTRQSSFKLFIVNEPKPDKTDFNNQTGIRYLLMGSIPEKQIPPGEKFQLKILFYPWATDADIVYALGSFYLATAVCGFGNRSRRGFGSWQITNIETSENFLPLPFKLTDYSEDNIYKVVDIIQQNVKEKFKLQPVNETSEINYAAIGRNQNWFKMITLVSNQNNSIDLLNEFGIILKDFRSKNKAYSNSPSANLGTFFNDRDFLFDMLSFKYQGGSSESYKQAPNLEVEVPNAVFGLNIIYERDSQKNYVFKLVLEKGKSELRRASPLWVSVKEIDSKICLRLALFKSKFKPDGALVMLKRSSKGQVQCGIVQPGNYSIIEDEFFKYTASKLS